MSPAHSITYDIYKLLARLGKVLAQSRLSFIHHIVESGRLLYMHNKSLASDS